MNDDHIISKKTGNIIYTSTESVIPDGPEKRLLALINGAEPQNESEKRMVEQINESKAKGFILDISAD